jgi:hypothetical protein
MEGYVQGLQYNTLIKQYWQIHQSIQKVQKRKFRLNKATCGGWKKSSERSTTFPSEAGNCRWLFGSTYKKDGTNGINDFEEKIISALFSDFLPGLCWSFFSSSRRIFVIWHLPLQFKIGRALFSQFLTNEAVNA